MLIDWFTVAAQLLNFLILVWLMKRFLYQPVLDAIASREKKIATELADAAATKAKAHTQQDEFSKKNQAFDAQRAELLRQAQAEAQSEGERLKAEARKAADEATAQRARALKAEATQLQAELTRQTQAQVMDIARRVLGDLATVGLEAQACEVFITRLQGLEGSALDELDAAVKGVTDADPALLRSAFPLPQPQRVAVQAALDQRFGHPVALRFETAPDQVSGIEFSAQGQKLAWSIADYLSALSSTLEACIGDKATA